ncbi:MAG: M15 family metallopeptidase [Lewinellaceae bacterium]|nr:M15 family metallopeptidase [Lewinellaceae bacterium]
MTGRSNFILFIIPLFLGCQATPKKQEADTETEKDSIAVVVAGPASLPEEDKETSSINRPDYDTSQWTDLTLLDNSILIDMRYATEDNFVKERMYECGRCFLRPEVARAVVAAHRELQQQGLVLKMLDCYRPHPIQWKLWNKVPDRRYVSDPRKGSMHNRGAAVDLTLADRTGQELDMGTPYDFFGPEAHPSYQALPDSVLANRRLLRETMIRYGFKPIRTEWWHYSFGGKNYMLSDMLWKCY